MLDIHDDVVPGRFIGHVYMTSQHSVVDPTAQVVGRGKRIKGVSIDVAETGDVLDANGRKVVVLHRTNKGIMTELMNFRKVTGPTDSELRLQSRTHIRRK